MKNRYLDEHDIFGCSWRKIESNVPGLRAAACTSQSAPSWRDQFVLQQIHFWKKYCHLCLICVCECLCCVSKSNEEVRIKMRKREWSADTSVKFKKCQDCPILIPIQRDSGQWLWLGCCALPVSLWLCSEQPLLSGRSSIEPEELRS